MAKLDEQSRPKKKQPARAVNEPKSELRGRDLIYIDTDDDVTSIVGKIKASNDAVVALVPPKRVGVLQSVVNLKLLQRAARNEHKRLAIVTTDPALTNLASGLEIPVAKNINAQAKVPDMIDEDNISDIIDGSDIEVSSLPRRSSRTNDATEDKEISAAVAAIETDDKIHNDLNANGIPDDEEDGTEKKKPAKKIKVPNVNSLRKKILIGGGFAVVLAVFLVWALVFAPSATITIKAKTTSTDISKTLSLIPSTDKDADKGVISPVVKTKKANESVQFDPTGTKEIGEQAKGTIALCYNATPNDAYSEELKKNVVTVPAGTLFYANGMQFSIDASVDVQGGLDGSGSCTTYYSVKATAVNIGEDGNIEKNTTLTPAGFASSLTAIAKDDFTGGSKETVNVVQQSDVDAAVTKLKEQASDSDSVKSELEGQMADSTITIDGSFTVSEGDVKLSSAVGERADGKATATVEITYTLVGVNKSDLEDVLNAQINSQIKTDEQKVYDNGIDDVAFSGFATSSNGYTVAVKTKAHVGPVIDEDEVRESAVGKKSEEIKELLKKTNGVSDVEVTMSPFWVSNAPAKDKIKINFTIDE